MLKKMDCLQLIQTWKIIGKMTIKDFPIFYSTGIFEEVIDEPTQGNFTERFENGKVIQGFES